MAAAALARMRATDRSTDRHKRMETDGNGWKRRNYGVDTRVPGVGGKSVEYADANADDRPRITASSDRSDKSDKSDNGGGRADANADDRPRTTASSDRSDLSDKSDNGGGHADAYASD